MKRKIVNGFLLMAFAVSSVSTFVACKDYDEDVYVDLKGQIAKEKTQRELLQQQVDELEAFAKALKQCECDLQKELEDYLTKAEADGTYLRKDELENYLDMVTIRETIIKLLEEIYGNIDEKLKNYATKKEVADQISDLNEAIAEAKAMAEEAMRLAQAANCNCDLDGIKADIATLKELAAGWADQIADMMKKAKEALALAKANKIWIETYTKKIKELEVRIYALENGFPPSSVPDLSDILSRLDELEANSATKEELEEVNKLIGELQETIEDVKGIADEALEKAKANEASITDLETRVGELEDALNEAVKDLQDQIDALKERVDQLEEDVKRIDEEIEKLKADIQNMITGIIVQAAESPVVGYLNTPLGVNSTILAVYYGKPAADWDFPSTHSGNYVNASDYEKWRENNYRRLDVLGVKSQSDLTGHIEGGANDIIVSQDGNEGNAGTLYLTVNPSNVNFAGQTLTLKNSQDGDAPAVLSPLKTSDRMLTFGFTRAEGNGFYEAKATISKDNVENAKMNIDYNALQEDAQALLKDRTMSNVLDLGATLLKNAGDVMTAYGVAASWTDSISKTEHNIYSQYNVAATAVQPLSLAFLQNWKGINNVPGLGRLQDIVGRIIDNIKIDLNLPNIGDLDVTFKDIVVDPDKFNSLKVKLTLRVDGNDHIKIVGNNGEIYTVYFTAGDATSAESTDGKQLTIAELEKLADIKNETLADGRHIFTCYYYFGEEIQKIVTDLVKQVNESIPSSDLADLLNAVKDLADINSAIDETKNSIKEQISGYISRINNKLSQWISRAPSMMHLAMVVSKDGKVGMLSQSKYLPTTASGSVKLFPTTYNLELLAPTYKKFVAVTDVFDANGNPLPLDEAKAKASAANGGANMRAVFDGTTTCTLSGESGYIYEVTYTAVDYFGKVALRNYYIKF